MPPGPVGTGNQRTPTVPRPEFERGMSLPEPSKQPHITIRDIERIAEMHEIEDLQCDVWGSNDRDVVPYTVLAATKEVGGILVGAFDGSTLVGFAFSVVGRENDCLVHHSHMLGVKASHRNFNLGYKLKLAQRDRALAQGITHMTWTFDPLQGLNAYFNFNKLGVLADQYKVNFYGETTSSFLHQIGTDRLWATWLLDSARVCGRLGTRRVLDDVEGITTLVGYGDENEPQRNRSTGVLQEERLILEIPIDINTLQRESPELAVRWREVTREAFTEAVAAGYLVEEFQRTSQKDRQIGLYVLGRNKRIKEFE